MSGGGGLGQKVKIFSAAVRSSVHLIIGKKIYYFLVRVQQNDYMILNCLQKQNTLLILLNKEIHFVLNLHHDKSNNNLFVNGVKIYKFKAKDSELTAYPIFFLNISKDFLGDNVKEARLIDYVYGFSVDFYSIDVKNNLDIHSYFYSYLMKRNGIK